jgi:hypothetical protein
MKSQPKIRQIQALKSITIGVPFFPLVNSPFTLQTRRNTKKKEVLRNEQSS